jgi:hypothetical protein
MTESKQAYINQHAQHRKEIEHHESELKIFVLIQNFCTWGFCTALCFISPTLSSHNASYCYNNTREGVYISFPSSLLKLSNLGIQVHLLTFININAFT